MLPDKYQKFLDRLAHMYEFGPHSGEINLGTAETGIEPYWADGYNPRPMALNQAKFYVWKGNVYMVTDVYTKREQGLEKTFDVGYFMVFYFGNNFHIDQTIGVELPERHQEGIVQRLKLGF